MCWTGKSCQTRASCERSDGCGGLSGPGPGRVPIGRGCGANDQPRQAATELGQPQADLSYYPPYRQHLELTMVPSDAPPVASASTSSLPPSPTSKLSALDDPTKKYTLIFLVSVGTTLLVTGASGGRLLKRAKSATAPPSAAPSPSGASLRPSAPPPSAAPPRATPAFSTPPAPHPSTKRAQHVLKSFRVPSTASPSVVQGRKLGAGPNDFFLPNAVILDHSNAFAEQLDREDRLHKDGPDQPDAPDDGFNPALFAAKAFAIATALTGTAFAAGIGGLMYYLGAEDVSAVCPTLSARFFERETVTDPLLTPRAARVALTRALALTPAHPRLAPSVAPRLGAPHPIIRVPLDRPAPLLLSTNRSRCRGRRRARDGRRDAGGGELLDRGQADAGPRGRGAVGEEEGRVGEEVQGGERGRRERTGRVDQTDSGCNTLYRRAHFPAL